MDHSRVNEFGFSGDMLEEATKKKLQTEANGNVAPNAALDQTPHENKKQKSAKAKKSD